MPHLANKAELDKVLRVFLPIFGYYWCGHSDFLKTALSHWLTSGSGVP